MSKIVIVVHCSNTDQVQMPAVRRVISVAYVVDQRVMAILLLKKIVA